MPELPQVAGPLLLAIAREAIAARVGVPDPRFRTPDASPGALPGSTAHLEDENAHPWLDTPGAAFVTLTQQGALRGCIGSLTAYRPLREDVADNAVNAALRDPRFPPLSARELAETRIEVSVLSEPEPYPFTHRADAVSGLRPGVDGLILEYGSHRGTFLPQVWDSLTEPDDFLAHLVRKAGLPAGWWDDDARLSRYTVKAFEET
jgi:AmmeMemoRadiSam system protein A